MRLKRIEIEDYKCIRRFDFDLTDPATNDASPFAAIIGPNGSGKTSVLQLVAQMLEKAQATRQYQQLSKGSRSWNHDDRIRATLHLGGLFLAIQDGSLYSNQAVFWNRSEVSNCLYVPASRDPWIPLGQPIKPGHGIRLPVELALSTKTESTKKRVEHIHQWLMHERLKGDVPALWDAVAEFLAPIRYAGVRSEDHDLLFDVDGRGTLVGFNQLSAGQRKLILLLAEIIHHCDGKGILLLDEPEAHFHPRWQRTLRASLTRLLPEGQVIVATHSPFVIDGIPSHELFVIKDTEDEA